MAGQEVFLALAEGELDVEHAAVAQDHDEEAQAPACVTHGDHLPTAPVDLRALSRRKGQGQVRLLAAWPDLLDVVLHDRDPAVEALVAQQGQDLHRRIGVFLEHAHDLALEGIEHAGAFDALARPVRLLQPLAHRARRQPQGAGDLRGAQAVAFRQLLQPAPLLVVDHRTPPSRCCRTAPIDTGSPSRRGRVRGAQVGGCIGTGARSRT